MDDAASGKALRQQGTKTNKAISGLFHFAYPCRDAQETADFYEKLLELPLVSFMLVPSVPSTGEAGPYAHLFFEMRDGSYLAFFDLGKGVTPEASPNTPRWVQHFAMEVDSVAEVQRFHDKLKAAGVDVIGVVDHHFIKSVYFFDPNGLRLEITARTEPEGYVAKEAAEAHKRLKDWNKFKFDTWGTKAAEPA